jgi:hypothetical protein
MIQLESLFSKNNLVINTDKTKAMLFQLNKTYVMTEPVIKFKKKEITYTSQFRFLGINIINFCNKCPPGSFMTNMAKLHLSFT